MSSLVEELNLLREKYKACLRVQQSKEYRKFSESTRKAEAEAFMRMQKRGVELQELIAKGG